jgi:hypothetical protein
MHNRRLGSYYLSFASIRKATLDLRLSYRMNFRNTSIGGGDRNSRTEEA